MLTGLLIISFVTGGMVSLMIWLKITERFEANVKFLHNYQLQQERRAFKIAILNYASAHDMEIDLCELDGFRQEFETNQLILKALASDQD